MHYSFGLAAKYRNAWLSLRYRFIDNYSTISTGVKVILNARVAVNSWTHSSTIGLYNYLEGIHHKISVVKIEIMVN